MTPRQLTRLLSNIFPPTNWKLFFFGFDLYKSSLTTENNNDRIKKTCIQSSGYILDLAFVRLFFQIFISKLFWALRHQLKSEHCVLAWLKVKMYVLQFITLLLLALKIFEHIYKVWTAGFVLLKGSFYNEKSDVSVYNPQNMIKLKAKCIRDNCSFCLQIRLVTHDLFVSRIKYPHQWTWEKHIETLTKKTSLL